MAEGFKFTKNLRAETDEVLIRACVADREGGAWHAVTFEKSRIDYITEVAGGVSGIALKTGAKIAVAMPYEELERKIYFADAREAPVLDLRGLTGPAAKEAIGKTAVPAPAADFAAVAPAKKPLEKKPPQKKPMIDKPLKIAGFARQSGEQNFQMVFVMDSSIDWSGVTAEDGKNGKAVSLPLRFGKSPFGENSLLLDISRAAFMELYNQAKMEGLDELDLRDLTRRRDPDKAPTPPSAPPSA